MGYDLREPLGRHEVTFTERDRAAPNTKQFDDREVFARLRHHAIIGRNDQQREVDAGCAREHGVHQPLVPRHIDKSDDVAGWARQIGKSEFDGDAALLLFLEAIGIDAGERAHEARLAMIDVTRGADDHGPASPSGNVRASSLPRSTSAGVSEPKTGLRNFSARRLPSQRARISQA